MNRRTLLQTLAALPLCGWMRPKQQIQMPIEARCWLRFPAGNTRSIKVVSYDCGRTWKDRWTGQQIELLKAIAARVEKA
jgi:hypothetical protein